MELFGWMAPPVSDGGGSPMWGALHDWALPVLFTAVIATHLAAVLKHHFLARHIGDVRRMLR